MLVDKTRVTIKAGDGGKGSAVLRRDAMTAKGGPDGGNGGRGGHVIVRGNKQLWTLLHLKYRKHVIAEPGGSGGSALKTGATGKDEIIEVPLGTVARDFETGDYLFEIEADGQEEVLVRGGRGGMGNAFFKSPTMP